MRGSAVAPTTLHSEPESSTSRSSTRHSSSSLIDVVIEATDVRKRLTQRRTASTNLAQLRLSHMKLHGRDDDVALLHDKLINIQHANREMILVAGSSGVGKSYLVLRTLQNPALKGVTFASGKFDQNSYNLPFSAFAHCLSSLSKQAMSSNTSSTAQQIKQAIQSALSGDDAQMIVSALPGCELFFAKTEHDQGHRPLLQRRNSMDDSANKGKENVNRMHYAIRRLLKAICSNLQGCCLFIDDLQWADSSSLDLLQTLLQDEEIPSLLLVGAYRDNEVSESHPLTLVVNEAERLGCNVTNIKLANIENQHVQAMVAEALDMPNEEVKTLSDIIYKKTKGSPLFVILFLRSIYNDNSLEYNFVVERWRWDDTVIREKTLTDNIASIIANNLTKFKASEGILKIAACLGHSFSPKVLELVVDHSFTDREDFRGVGDVLSELENEGLIEENDDQICFSHDLIQSSALELIPLNERNAFKGEIGLILLNNLDPHILDDYLFDAISLRNCTDLAELSETEKERLIDLNLQAGIKASNNVAFDSAVVYLTAARALLKPDSLDSFEIDNIAIQIYNAEAKARFIIGDLGKANDLLDELLKIKNNSLSMSERFKAYEMKILVAQTLSNFDDAISLALELRKELMFKPIPLHPSMFTIIKEYMKTRRVLKKRSVEELVSLPDLTDERVIFGQRMLDLLATSAYQANPQMYPIIPFRMARQTIESGINETSSVAYVAMGLLQCGAFGEFDRGREMGRAAELLLERKGMRDMISRIRFLNQGMIQHWTTPLKRTLTPLLDGYIIGLETGDTESAGWNICLRCCFSWFCARPIADLISEIRPILNVFEQLSFASAKMCTLPFLQAAENLSSAEVISPWLLSSNRESVGDTQRFAKENGNEMVRSYTTVVQLDMLIFFHKWDEAKRLLIECGDLRHIIFALFHVVRFTFQEALISLKLAQIESGWSARYKWKIRARKVMKLMKGWLKKGNVNCLHMYHLLVAEYSVLCQKNKQAEESFKLAQSAAGRSGYLQDKALAHEMAGLYYIKRTDEYWAKHNFALAQRTWQDLGATAKAKHIEEEFSQYINIDMTT